MDKTSRKPYHESVVDSLIKQLRLRREATGFHAKHDCTVGMGVLLDLLDRTTIPDQYIEQVSQRLDLVAQEARDAEDPTQDRIQSIALSIRKQ